MSVNKEFFDEEPMRVWSPKLLKEDHRVCFSFGELGREITARTSEHLRDPNSCEQAARRRLVTHFLAVPTLHQTEVRLACRSLDTDLE